jgi:hypothetical protein
MALIAGNPFLTIVSNIVDTLGVSVAPGAVKNLVSIVGGDLGAASRLIGVSPSRIEKYLTGQIRPSIPVLSRFQRQYEVNAYSILRSYGAGWRDAMSLSSKAPGAILERIQYLDEMASALSKYHGVDIKAIRKGMSESDNTSDSWDESNAILMDMRAGRIK